MRLKTGGVPTKIRLVPGGPMLVDGPVELTTEDGSSVVSGRFVVAVCTCRRSKRYPLCDTSHRKRERTDRHAGPE